MVAQKAMRSARLASAFMAASALTGCLNLAEYREPEVDLPDRYALLAPVPVSTPETAQWWRLFEDPLLNDLVDRVQTENLDLKEAGERVIEARAIARREGNTLSGSANLGANARTVTDTVGFGLSLTLDPFGRGHREVDIVLTDQRYGELTHRRIDPVVGPATALLESVRYSV